jgi:hypothetical protein
VIVREGYGVEEAFVTLHGGIAAGRRCFVTQFVHSAVNWLRRPGGRRIEQREWLVQRVGGDRDRTEQRDRDKQNRINK